MSIPAPPALTDYASVRQYLYGLKHHGAKYGIDRMRLLAARLGHPERDVPIVHLAGTNGKGSVAAMVECIVRTAGYRTGLYTSPHLVRQGERVQINRTILREDQIVAYVRELQPIAARLGAHDPDDHPSFFEFMTAMAFLHFQREKIDLAIIETGLGGRLDATNVVRPELSVITEIGHDHMEFLGDSITEIATEKAGIIKAGRPVVMGSLNPESDAVIRGIAAERGCPLVAVDDVFGRDPAGFPLTNLEGSYQRANAATAVLVARSLRSRFAISEATISTTLQQIDWPGRWQHVALADRGLIFDAAHNPEGADCLEENLARLIAATGRRPVMVIGVLGAHRARAIIPIAARYADSLHLVTVPHQPRSCSPGELAQFVPPDFTGSTIPAAIDALFPDMGTCSAGSPGDTIVITGSIYLLGEVMDRVFHAVPVNQGMLQD